MAQTVPNLNYPITSSSKSSLIFAGDNGAADEGNYFSFTTATPATGVATTTSVVDDAATQSSTHGQASPAFLLQNQNSTGSGINIYLRYLKFSVTAVPTSATIWNYSFRLDPLSTKLTTAGTVLTPHNVNSLSTNQSRAYINVGTITTVIMSAQGWLVAAGEVNGALPVVNDQYVFTFGDVASSHVVNGTTTNQKFLTIPVCPIVVAPGYFLTMAMFGASNAGAPAFAVEGGYIERPTGQ